MKIEKSSKLAISEKLSQLKGLLFNAAEELVKAGEIVIGLIEDDGLSPDDIATNLGVPKSTIRSLQAIAMKQQHPDLFFAETPGRKALRKMPYKFQEKYLTEPLPLVVRENGHTEILLTQIDNLTSDQSAQVFGHGEIRDEAAQRAWIESYKLKTNLPPAATSPYRIIKNKVMMLALCTLTKKDVLRILEEMD